MPTAVAQLDDVFARFPRWAGEVPAGIKVNFLGVKTNERFTAFMQQHAEPRQIQTQYPPACEDSFEYIDILEAVTQARGSFTMMELGAGYGRWLVNAAVALRQSGDLPCHLIGVEAEPTHYRWMHEHFQANGLDPNEHRLLSGAVAAADGDVEFIAGRADSWYAQAIATPQFVEQLQSVEDSRSSQDDELKVTTVRAWSISSLLNDLRCIDLIDLDIQGAEYEVLSSATDALDEKVKRIHIGTHSREIENNLRGMFNELGWKSIHDYGCLQTVRTPLGDVTFEDGVQTWLNPRLLDRTNTPTT